MLAEAVAEPKEDTKPADTPKQPKAVKSEQGIIVEGLDNCLVKFSKAHPVPGDDIVGFITRGYGVSVHRADCPNAAPENRKPEEAARWVRVSWVDSKLPNYRTALEVASKDRDNLTLDVAMALSAAKVKVTACPPAPCRTDTPSSASRWRCGTRRSWLRSSIS